MEETVEWHGRGAGMVAPRHRVYGRVLERAGQQLAREVDAQARRIRIEKLVAGHGGCSTARRNDTTCDARPTRRVSSGSVFTLASSGLFLHDFWRWAASDLLNNTTRGLFAEYLVARAIGVSHADVRTEWDAFDLTTSDGIRVEVKSAASVQSWSQSRESVIVFRVPKTRAWSAETNVVDAEARRQAQVYVFAHLHEREAPDPLNVLHWTFYVVPTVQLDRRVRSQLSISLGSLRRESTGPVAYGDLLGEIGRAAVAV